MEAWYDDIDSATLQRIKTYSAFNDAMSKNLMVQTMYEYREKEVQDFKETNHELAETCIARKKRIAELEKENAELKELLDCNNCCELEESECESCAEFGQVVTLYLNGRTGNELFLLHTVTDDNRF